MSGSMVEFPPSAATAINDYGQVVVWPPSPGVFLWTPDTANGSTGSFVRITFGDSETAFPTGINSNGQIVGVLGSPSEQRALLWTPTTPNSSTGSFVELGYLPGRTDTSWASAINSLGQVVGISRSDRLLPPSHAFLWTPNTPNGTTGAMVDLGDLPGGNDSSVANAVNSRGQVVGQSSSSMGYNAFLWSPTTPNGTTGSMVDLGALPDEFSVSVANDINAQGYVVGHSGAGPTTSTRAFLWEPDSPNTSTGKMVDLNSVLEPISGRNWILYTASAINDGGQIVGTGLLSGSQRAFLLTPVPEPSTLALSTITVLLLICRTRRVTG
jgi:probable HAF family extracellular repeat protein